MSDLAARLDAVIAGMRAALAEAEKLRAELVDEDAALLAAIHRYAGDSLFTVAEVLTSATASATLRAAIDADGPAGSHSLGRRLAKLEGRTIGGLRLVRVGKDRAGALWRIGATTL